MEGKAHRSLIFRGHFLISADSLYMNYYQYLIIIFALPAGLSTLYRTLAYSVLGWRQADLGRQKSLLAWKLLMYDNILLLNTILIRQSMTEISERCAFEVLLR